MSQPKAIQIICLYFKLFNNTFLTSIKQNDNSLYPALTTLCGGKTKSKHIRNANNNPSSGFPNRVIKLTNADL